MATSKKPKPWEAAFRRIRVEYWPQYNYPPKPTAADLDAAEAALNFRFPLSYRAFAEEFGLDGDLHNTLPHVLPLTQPTWEGATTYPCSVVGATEEYHARDWEGEGHLPSDNPPEVAFLQRMVVFAWDSGYHDWVFDPLEVTDGELREYRIYDISRSTVATPVAASFDEWLGYIDQSYRFDDDEPKGGKEPEFLPVFKPDSSLTDAMIYARYGLRQEKQRPDKADAKHWLACNDGAALGLARAIREDGRPEVFPILADALEEAGCQNRDMLDSCRYGDPDIDGVWVLQVLLGKPPKPDVEREPGPPDAPPA